MGEVRRLRVESPPLELVFSHESEQQVADLLDFYEIAWEYEPRTFVLETAADGNPRTVSYTHLTLPTSDLV
mgnify:CR=1 FL=1